MHLTSDSPTANEGADIRDGIYKFLIIQMQQLTREQVRELQAESENL